MSVLQGLKPFRFFFCFLKLFLKIWNVPPRELYRVSVAFLKGKVIVRFQKVRTDFNFCCRGSIFPYLFFPSIIRNYIDLSTFGPRVLCISPAWSFETIQTFRHRVLLSFYSVHLSSIFSIFCNFVARATHFDINSSLGKSFSVAISIFILLSAKQLAKKSLKSKHACQLPQSIFFSWFF